MNWNLTGWLPVTKVPMYQCVPMCTNLYQCVPIFTNMYQCVPIYTNVYQCCNMYQYVHYTMNTICILCATADLSNFNGRVEILWTVCWGKFYKTSWYWKSLQKLNLSCLCLYFMLPRSKVFEWMFDKEKICTSWEKIAHRGRERNANSKKFICCHNKADKKSERRVHKFKMGICHKYKV